MSNKPQHLTPGGLSKIPGYSQVVTKGKRKTMYIGSQDVVNVQEEMLVKETLPERQAGDEEFTNSAFSM